MPDGRNIVYLFDGSMEGFLTVCFDCFKKDVYGVDVEGEVQQELGCSYEYIEADAEKARRVYSGIRHKISKAALENVQVAFWYQDNSKFLTMFQYIREGFRVGSSIDMHLTKDCVAGMAAICRNVKNEAHYWCEFCRFSETKEGVLYSKVGPKNYVLEIMAGHFADRFIDIPFVIHDENRHLAAAYNTKEWVIAEVPKQTALTLSETEKDYRELWYAFYRSIAVEGRQNKKLQRSNMPKRYQKYAVEFSDVALNARQFMQNEKKESQ